MKLVIEQRFNCAGVYVEGSIFNSTMNFSLQNSIASTCFHIEFCVDTTLELKSLAKAEVEFPFRMTSDDICKLQDIIAKIRGNSDYLYQESHYSKESRDPNIDNYMDVYIDDDAYEIPIDDNILKDLMDLINGDKVFDIVFEYYDKLIK